MSKTLRLAYKRGLKARSPGLFRLICTSVGVAPDLIEKMEQKLRHEIKTLP